LLLGVLDHGKADAILHGSPRIHGFQLAEHAATRLFAGQAPDLHQRRVGDQIDNPLVNERVIGQGRERVR
jgi:hypothetical protein